MSNFIFVFALGIVCSAASCTPAEIVIKHNDCDGKFWVSEYQIPCDGGLVTIGKTHNIREGVKGNMTAGALHGSGSIVHITGELEDPCKVGSITYTHPCGERTVDIERLGVRVTAPARVRIQPNGMFEYKLQISCCPDTDGEVHDLSVSTTPNILALPLLNSHKCPGGGPIDIWGAARDLAVGGSVTVTITGPESSCTVTTMIDP